MQQPRLKQKWLILNTLIGTPMSSSYFTKSPGCVAGFLTALYAAPSSFAIKSTKCPQFLQGSEFAGQEEAVDFFAGRHEGSERFLVTKMRRHVCLLGGALCFVRPLRK